MEYKSQKLSTRCCVEVASCMEKHCSLCGPCILCFVCVCCLLSGDDFGDMKVHKNGLLGPVVRCCCPCLVPRRRRRRKGMEGEGDA